MFIIIRFLKYLFAIYYQDVKNTHLIAAKQDGGSEWV